MANSCCMLQSMHFGGEAWHQRIREKAREYLEKRHRHGIWESVQPVSGSVRVWCLSEVQAGALVRGRQHVPEAETEPVSRTRKWTCLLCGVHNRTPQTGGLYHRNGFSHNSGGWKSKNKVLSGLVSSETCLPSLQRATFSLCPYMLFMDA